MGSLEPDHFDQLPNEMFSIIKNATNSLGPRLGRLSIPRRRVIETPHYLALTSRGTIPHISQDTFIRDTGITSVYVPLEDFIEKAPYKVPPLYKLKPSDGSSPLRRFIALPDETLLVLGARRTPPVIPPPATPNTNTSVAICTAVGFRPLNAEDYAEAVEDLKPDIIVGLGDIPHGRALGSKRIEKGTDRQIEWMQEHVALRKAEGEQKSQSILVAPLLPVPCANQQFYLDCLTEHLAKDVSGLAIYNSESLEELPEDLHHLPRFAYLEPTTPQQMLKQIASGLDLLTVPFVSAATDAGIALDFTFPAPTVELGNIESAAPLPLAIDMWLSSHAADLSPLVQDCKCYTCTNHHRAYTQHLLAAKEMLAWVLLQIHNHHVVDLFFAGVRKSISGDTFDHEMRRFEQVYESQLPEKTGQGPRIRGYQFKAEGPGEQKKNKPPFTLLNDTAQNNADSTPPDVDTDVEGLERQGFAQKEEQPRSG